MKPVGNKYLIKVEKPAPEVVDGIIIPPPRLYNDIFYKGKIVAHGTHMEVENPIPEGSEVIFDWKDKNSKVKVVVDDSLYYICSPKAVLGVV